MTTDQTRPSVNELASDSRFARAPQKLVRSNLSPKGHKGICVGRDELLNGLGEYFVERWQRSKAGTVRHNDCVAAVLTNAPGVGKTTVCEEFAFRLAPYGIAVIDVDAAQLATERQLVKTLRLYAAQGDITAPIQDPEKASLMQRAANWALSSQAVPLLGGMGALALTGTPLAAMGATAGVHFIQEAIQRLRSDLDGPREMTAEEVLKAVNRAHDGRFIVWVDECHELQDSVLRTPELLEHIGYLTKPLARRRLDITGGGMLFAGLASFPDELDGLGLTRAKVEWLDELDGDSAEEIVRHYLKETTMRKQRREAITGRWVTELAHSFRHWPQHSAAAGLFAKELLEATNKKWRYNPADPEEDELLQHTLTMAARDIRELYQQRVRNATTAQPTIRPEDIAALANVTDDQIPHKALALLINRSMRESELPVSNDSLTECLRDLKRAGLCRDRTVQRDGREIEYYSFAMPSLRQHITDNANPELLRKCMERAQQILRDASD